LGMTNLEKWWREQVQIEETNLRYFADLPPRNDREQEAYRAWADFEARNPQAAEQNASYRAIIRSKEPGELWDIAASTVAAQREAWTPPPDWLGEPEHSPSGDAELEAGS
jgi:hypothetical protein